MKILVVSTVQTHPTTSGSARFINSYSSMLKKMGHEVFFLHVPPVYKDTTECLDGIHESQKYWGDHYCIYRISFINKIVEKTNDFLCKLFFDSFSSCDNKYIWGLGKYVNTLDRMHHFDACLINYFWLTKLFEHISIPKKGIITHDSFTYNNLRNNVNSLLNLRPNEEAKALQRCPFIFAMQDEEKVLFERLSPKSKVLLSYCIYDFHNQQLVHNHNLVLLSSAFYLNINGLNWFFKNIFPEILKKYPDCRLKLAGSICNPLVQSELPPNVDLLGYVEDAAELYSLGDVAINPTFQGTGLKIKTFEAVSYNKVTMVHPHSAHGIFDKENSPLFVSEDAREWVNYLDRIWNDNDSITEVRHKNELYIRHMNEFVKNQFDMFLS